MNEFKATKHYSQHYHHLKTTNTTFIARNHATPDIDQKKTEFDYECDTCKLEDRQTRAYGFCTQCKKAMCVDCQQKHQNQDSFWQHSVVYGSEMNSILNEYLTKRSVDHCHKHRYRILEFYCKRHSEVLCSECRDTSHSDCWDVTDTDIAARGMKGDRELHQTIQETRQLLKEFDKLNNLKVENIKKLNVERFTCLQSVQNFRKEIDTILSMLERSLRSEIEKRFAKELSELEESKSICEKRLLEIREESRILDEAKSADNIRSFISMVTAKKKITEWELLFTQLEKECKETKFTFEPNYKLLDTLKDTENVGLGCMKVQFSWPKSARISENQPLDLKRRLNLTTKVVTGFERISEHNIYSGHDVKASCTISGATTLSDGKVLLCDGRNQKLKLLDENLQFQSTFTLPSAPSDVTMLTNRDAVVTLPDSKELHYVIIDPGFVFRRSRVVHTATACHGVCAHKDGLLVTCYNHGVFGIMLLLDLEGRVKRRFERAPVGEPVFQGPFHIALDRVRDRYYVSDKASNTLVALSIGGKVIFR